MSEQKDLLGEIGRVARTLDSEPLAEERVSPAFLAMASQTAMRELRKSAGSDAAPPRVVGFERFKARRAGLFLGGAAALAAAAALALFVRSDGAALPEFDVVSSGGDRQLRGAPVSEKPAPILALHDDDHIDLLLRPAKATNPLFAQCFLVSGADVRPFAPVPEISKEGAVRLRGTAPELRRAERLDCLLSRSALDRADATEKLKTTTGTARAIRIPIVK